MDPDSLNWSPFPKPDSPHQDTHRTEDNELNPYGFLDPDESSDPPLNESMQQTDPKSNRFLYLTRPKEEPYSKPRTPEWHEEHTVKLPKLANAPGRVESKKDMKLDLNCKHPLSQWLKRNPKHQRNLNDFNGVVQSESRRKTLADRWRKEARQREETKPRLSRWEIIQSWNEQKEREAMKTDEEKEQDRKRIVAHVKVSCWDSSKHQQLQKYMNSMQNESDGILEINMSEKANWQSSVEKKKWKVIGLINPDVHLSTLDHSVNLNSIPLDSHSIPILNYHHWIPAVFKVNSKGMDSPHSLIHHSAEQTFEM